MEPNNSNIAKPQVEEPNNDKETDISASAYNILKKERFLKVLYRNSTYLHF
jgi:hypothetical protein